MKCGFEGIAVLVKFSNECLDLNSDTICLIFLRARQQKGADDRDATKGN
jgi:hypothetical protein